jgi:hypothetical protein
MPLRPSSRDTPSRESGSTSLKPRYVHTHTHTHTYTHTFLEIYLHLPYQPLSLFLTPSPPHPLTPSHTHNYTHTPKYTGPQRQAGPGPDPQGRGGFEDVHGEREDTSRLHPCH